MALEIESECPEKVIFENHIAVIAALFIFSYIGTLIRVYVQIGLTYIGEPVASIIYPQFIGCIIMGIATDMKSKIDPHAHTLFTGITAGLCGSITSFSGVISGSAQQYFNTGGYTREKIQSVIGGLSIVLLGFGIGYVGFVMGRHLGRALNKGHTKENFRLTYAPPVWFKRQSLTKSDIFIFIVALGMIASVICVGIRVHTKRNIIYTVIFAPAGTLIRRLFSYLNLKHKKFPIGTFIVNMAGSAIVTILYLLPGVTQIHPYQCDIIAGLVDGFCGCLTTISTWIVEVSFLKTKNSYIYGGLSILIAEILNVIIFFSMGVPRPYNNQCT